MPLLHGTNTVNVEASVHKYFESALATIPKPSYLPSDIPIIANMPEQAIIAPAFSFHHLPAGSRDVWQGRVVGEGVRGVKAYSIFEINCWVSRSSAHWAAQVKYMHSMIDEVYGSANGGLPVLDFVSSPTNPTTLPYLIRLIELEVLQTAPDPNPDLERRRIHISYCWVLRSS